MKILRLILKIIWNTFIVYAILFSLAATIGLCYLGTIVYAPIKQVKGLSTHNPLQTSFMKNYEATKKLRNLPFAQKQIFIPIDSIAPSLLSAVLAAEDDGFYSHPGFDLEAMLEAMQYNRSHNSIKRGASTITQQLAKNLFLKSDRTFSRKYQELFYTVLLEQILGKKRILELYLNYAQWGPDIFGCEAATQLYFGKSSRKLTQYESARMAAVLAMPEKLSPKTSKTLCMSKRLSMIATNLYLRGQLRDTDYTLITNLPPPRDTTEDSTVIDEQ